MSTISTQNRDWAAVLDGFRSWLSARWPAAESITVDLAEQVPTNGFSSESALVDITWQETGADHSSGAVLRLPPSGDGIFPEYDLVRQARAMEVARAGGVPAPKILGVEPNPSYVGSEFLAMELVRGRIPADDPLPYCMAGWLFDATPSQQRMAYDSFHDALADVGTVNAVSSDLSSLARPQGPGLLGELGWWSDYLHWATDGSPPDAMVEIVDWLRTHLPDEEPPASLVWGDARLGNVIFDDNFRVGAVLDWEMAGVGPAEIDLGWSFAVRRSTQSGYGLPLDQELPGFPDRASTVDRYAKRLGRPVQDLAWYEVFAMIRMGSILKSMAALLRRRGITDHIIHRIPPLPNTIHDLMAAASG